MLASDVQGVEASYDPSGVICTLKTSVVKLSD
jgi:hypothetical protein